MRIHKRGIVSPYFEDVKNGRKRFEVRRETQAREFWVGDTLELIHETTGEKIKCKITYYYDGSGRIGLQEGFVILGVEVINGKEESNSITNEKCVIDDQGKVALNGNKNVVDSEQPIISREQRAGCQFCQS